MRRKRVKLARRPERDPLKGAAVLMLSFQRKGQSDTDVFRLVFEGVLEDLGLSEDRVESYLEAHRKELEEELEEKGM